VDYVADLFLLLNKLNCSLGAGGTSPGSKVTGRQAEYTPPSCAEVLRLGRVIPLFPFMTCTGTTSPLPFTVSEKSSTATVITRLHIRKFVTKFFQLPPKTYFKMRKILVLHVIV